MNEYKGCATTIVTKSDVLIFSFAGSVDNFQPSVRGLPLRQDDSGGSAKIFKKLGDHVRAPSSEPRQDSSAGFRFLQTTENVH